ITNMGEEGESTINLNYDSVAFTVLGTDVLIQTPYVLEFIIPSDFIVTEDSVTISVEGDGTQFSGTISLGVLPILNENVSGIYRIVTNKTNDTVYARTGFS